MADASAEAFRDAIAQAADQGRSLMRNLVAKAQKTAVHRSRTGPNDRSEQTEALKFLAKHESALIDAYPRELLAAFHRGVSEGAGRPDAKLSFDSLELMDDAQVQESVEVMRAEQSAGKAVEGQLAELNALISAARGFQTVHVDSNPLRPEVYVRALRSVFAEVGVPTAVRLRWMQQFGEALGEELRGVYAFLSGRLRSHGVTAASYAVTQQPDKPTPTRGVANDGAAQPAMSQQAQTLLTVDQLRRLLSGELEGGQRGGFAEQFAREFEAGGPKLPPAGYTATVPAALEALQDMNQVGEVMQRIARRDATPAASPGFPQGIPDDLRKQAQGVGQSLSLEVVHLMVDNIAADVRLLPPVQQLVRALEPALLRLALADPRFFSDRKHPARRLLEQMTQRSMAWQAVDAPGFTAFVEPLQQAVDVLLSTRTTGAEPFAFALRTLEEAWDERQGIEKRQREKAVRSLLAAEQRNLLAVKLGKEVCDRAEASGAAHEVVTFLRGPWAQVMAQARLTDTTGDPDPGGYSELVTELLWTTMPEVARANLSRLAKAVPPLLEKLREGLASIDYPRAKTEGFFQRLLELHRDAIQPAPVAPARRTREQLEAEFRIGDDAALWLAPSEAQDSGFMDTQGAAPARPLFEATQPAFSHTVSATSPAALPPRGAYLPPATIETGAWVELRVHGKWVRSQLTWASPHGTLYMFTNAGSSERQSMTRRTLEQMLMEGSMRLVSGPTVVDEALDAVAETAMRNSVDLNV